MYTECGPLRDPSEAIARRLCWRSESRENVQWRSLSFYSRGSVVEVERSAKWALERAHRAHYAVLCLGGVPARKSAGRRILQL